MTEQQKHLKQRLIELMRQGAWLPHHDCSACAEWVHYFMQEERLYFDSNCNCSRFSSQPRLCNIDDIDHMVYQTSWAEKLQQWAVYREKLFAAGT